MDQLIQRVLDDSDAALRAHFGTKSETEYQALGEFSDCSRRAMSSLVKSMRGLDIPAPDDPETSMLDTLEAAYIELAERRDDVCQGAAVLEMLFDALLMQYTVAIYRLKMVP